MAKAVTDPPPSSSSSSVDDGGADDAAGPPVKRRKVTSNLDGESPSPPLIPGLPDHIAQLCLTHLGPTTLFSVNRSWRRVISSPLYPPYLSLYTLLVPRSPDCQPPVLDPRPPDHADVCFSSYDPVSSTWQSLPPPPSDLRLLLCHPSFLSRRFPIQSVSAASHLVLLAASTPDLFPALPQPLIFDPTTRTWSFGPAFSAPRRWCAAGSLGGSVYVASGISSQFSVEVARSLERWDLRRQFGVVSPSGSGGWNKLTGLKDGRFCRDAIEAVGWKGKLCMVNVRGDAYKQGVVYNLGTDTWHEMPEGMLRGWRGPVAAMDEETMYCIDERKGALRRYEEVSDTWAFVAESEWLIGAQQMAAARGRVCGVCKGGEIAVVDVAEGGSLSSSSGKVWVVEPPAGLQAVGVHILPRMVNGEGGR